MAIITISRGSFAGGSAVAAALADQLGHPCLSREDILARAASDYGIVEAELRQALNESPRYWEQMPGKRMAYVKCLTAVLLEQARDGNLVYHGNVGHLLLAGIAHVLRVRVTADLGYRLQAAMKQAGLSREKALAHIRQVDEERRRWARALYGVEWDDPTQYHLTLNLGPVGVATASAVIARLSEAPEFAPTPESRRQFEDARLASRVWAALAKNPVSRSAGIQVTAHDGEVVITGNVGTAEAVELIPRLARGVEGVRSVRSEAGMGSDWYW
ncbi:MAG: cytidylate kinase family protein [Verrucomicrobia bacterium]|nr:cytidylate kinase family protein [Verrucomicrobiota bacterium]